jgi:hypothetical protein
VGSLRAIQKSLGIRADMAFPTGYNVIPMDPANNAEYEALQRNAQELRKELGMDKAPDRLDLLRTEVKILNGLKDLRKHDEVREPRDAECEKLEARIQELREELGLYQMDKLARLKLSLKNLEYLKESREERQRKQG